MARDHPGMELMVTWQTLRRPLWGIAALTGLALSMATSGCAPTQLVAHTAKQVQGPAEVEPRTEYGGTYKVGKPYQIAGIWYYPAVDYDFDETGVASWYGPNFHGKTSANGEIFNQWALTAAHRTLPMPSFVRVTNLENGRSVVVRINDRGPFAHERVIDMSRRGAQLLGFEKQGTARVRVQIIADKSRQVASRAHAGIGVAEKDRTAVVSPIVSGGRPSAEVNQQTLSPPTLAPVAKASPPAQPKVNPGVAGVYVQAAAFSVYENANRARESLSTIGPVEVHQILVNGRDWYRVRVGPFSSGTQGARALARVVNAGFADARLVTE
ncbi:septal ring lytic transglycosylase RlpA family protein [Magnetospira sp. QH-2]|uniref:septal ring lytic transglycosylase RlpA family protein n=1 Tax=Magnetospira sp. (strain QH-2) TaxID=1288970 RepID=UPI0003E80C57|nr:septal ring lytic transglycosylase RlpA family protein [Magnetospira sp. QH-2]CCQ73781.1 minor lipoprotein A [Magnetospira sp. QH-2]